MAKTTIFVLLLALFAGAAAGMAVRLLDPAAKPAGKPPPTPAAADARVDELAGAVARLNDTLEGLKHELDTLRARNEGLVEQLDALQEKVKAAPEPGVVAGADGHTIDLGNGRKGRIIEMGGRPAFLGGKATPGMKLAALPEEEKWTKLREELSLDSYQEEQLKQIALDYRNSFKDLFKVDEEGKFSLGKLDLGKIVKASADADEKVKNLLSDDQYRKYKDGGYGAAVGIGGATSVSVSTSFGSSEGK